MTRTRTSGTYTLEFAVTQSMAFTAAYVGNHSLNLRRSENINLIVPALGARPIAGFTNINIEMNNGQGHYDGLQLHLQQRFTKGLQLGISYAWGHSIDDVQDYGIYATNPQDNNNLKAEKGNSGDDVRHTVSYQLIYELPFGPGSSTCGVGFCQGLLVGGSFRAWADSQRHSGDGVLGVNTFGNGNLTNQRPNAVAGVSQYAANPNVNHLLNPAAYSLPAPGTFGNLGRNTFYGPHYAQEDLSLIQNDRFQRTLPDAVSGGGVQLPEPSEFRSAAEHVWDVDVWADVEYVWADFGDGVSRQIQLALKFYF